MKSKLVNESCPYMISPLFQFQFQATRIIFLIINRLWKETSIYFIRLKHVTIFCINENASRLYICTRSENLRKISIKNPAACVFREIITITAMAGILVYYKCHGVCRVYLGSQYTLVYLGIIV